MSDSPMVMYEDEFQQIQTELQKLVESSHAKASFIVDKNGQLIATAGVNVEALDTTSLASLTAGNIAATGGMAKLLREKEFTTQYHEGAETNFYIQLVGNRVILVIIFDTNSALGLIRLRAKKSAENLSKIFDSMLIRASQKTTNSPFAEITDEDIDNLFKDN